MIQGTKKERIQRAVPGDRGQNYNTEHSTRIQGREPRYNKQN